MPSERVELLALDIYARAEADGLPVTLDLVQRRLEQLAAHADVPVHGVWGGAGPALGDYPGARHQRVQVCAAWQRWAARQRPGTQTRRART